MLHAYGLLIQPQTDQTALDDSLAYSFPMFQIFNNLIREALRYTPLDQTANVRQLVDANRVAHLPYCPAPEGDLLHSLIRENGCRQCLETGFHTGSTALYMADAVAGSEGTVTSITIDDDDGIARGMALLEAGGQSGHHRLIRDNNSQVLPELLKAGEQFDLIFMDGWKTFDHLAMEMYYFNRLLRRGGVIFFDDAYMPSVRRAARLLKRYYGYQEVIYNRFNETFRLRLYQILTRASPYRPYWALTKTIETGDQIPDQDWNFDRSL